MRDKLSKKDILLLPSLSYPHRLFDMGSEYAGYTADITVSFPANGKFTEKQKFVYETCYDANKKVIAAMKPGIERERECVCVRERERSTVFTLHSLYFTLAVALFCDSHVIDTCRSVCIIFK